MMPPPSPLIRVVSRCALNAHASAAADGDHAAVHPCRCEMSVWDLTMLPVNYIQNGHLFTLPPRSSPVDVVIDRLKTSLSVSLGHFYPLAGRLAIETKDADGQGTYVHIDCNDRGAEFVYAVAEGVGVADVLAPFDDVPGFVRCLFPLDGAVNYDGCSLPLLAVQVTELSDGIFLGCSFNHAVGDGTSFWNFFNAWAEIARSSLSSGEGIPRPPVHDRWFADERSPIRLPFSDVGRFVEPISPPPLRERVFHFSAGSVAALKARANSERGAEEEISSFQALSAFTWRCITRARRHPDEQKTGCNLWADNRARLRPQLPPDYFGNSICMLTATAAAGELLVQGLGWAAGLLHRCVAAHADAGIRGRVERWMASPSLYTLSGFDGCSISMGRSPRFDMYGCDFGWGKAVAVRSGRGNKFDGKVVAHPGREGGGSVDLEVCLRPEVMGALESDEEFMGAVSKPSQVLGALNSHTLVI